MNRLHLLRKWLVHLVFTEEELCRVEQVRRLEDLSAEQVDAWLERFDLIERRLALVQFADMQRITLMDYAD